MTVYFPLVVHGAMLIEPTESESKQSLDQFIGALRVLGGSGDGGRQGALQGRAAFRPEPPAGRNARGPAAGAELYSAGGESGGLAGDGSKFLRRHSHCPRTMQSSRT